MPNDRAAIPTLSSPVPHVSGSLVAGKMDIAEILRSPDDLKFCSSATLFRAVTSPGPLAGILITSTKISRAVIRVGLSTVDDL
jgi:hypothetical protein